MGASISPDDAFQALRGLRTLKPRLDRHGSSGLKVAAWLDQEPSVARVLHPGLPGDPGHALWARDFSGASGLFGVILRPAPEAALHTFINRLALFTLGFSWGGYESLAIHCGPQLQGSRAALAAEGHLVRLHVGLEDADDLIADLTEALAAYPGT
jgi:cystathionine beta-lyase